MEKVLVNALTRSESKIVNVITTPVDVKNLLTQSSISTAAIWDTGATSSVVTKDIAAQLGLIPMGKTNDPCPCGSGKKYKHCCGRNG